jgi:hypothetical protein
MTNAELAPYIGSWVILTLTDGDHLSGKLTRLPLGVYALEKSLTSPVTGIDEPRHHVTVPDVIIRSIVRADPALLG